MSCSQIVRFVQTATHELLGHGTGKLLTETAPGVFNFDQPPISPVTGQPVDTWYTPGQTWNTVFGKIATTVEECRAFLVADYLADNKDILAVFGYNDESTPTAEDSTFKANTSSLTLTYISHIPHVSTYRRGGPTCTSKFQYFGPILGRRPRARELTPFDPTY